MHGESQTRSVGVRLARADGMRKELFVCARAERLEEEMALYERWAEGPLRQGRASPAQADGLRKVLLGCAW